MFEYYLAERLRMTVERMRREISSNEFLHWAMYYSIKAQDQEMEAKRGR